MKQNCVFNILLFA